MKHLCLVAFLLITCSLKAQNAIEKYFQDYENDKAFTSVYISKHMFDLFADLEVENEEDAEILKMIGNLENLHILTTDSRPQYYYQNASNAINPKEYKLLMKVKEEGNDIKFLIKENGNTIEELVLLVGGDEFILMSIVGNINLKKITQLSKYMDIDGLEHLESVEK